MQDHFIKNVNDLSLCMTFTSDIARANREVCTYIYEQQHRDSALLMTSILLRYSCPTFTLLSLRTMCLKDKSSQADRKPV